MESNYGIDGFLYAQRRINHMLCTIKEGIQNLSISELARQHASTSEMKEASKHYTLDVRTRPDYKIMQENLESISQTFLQEAKRRDGEKERKLIILKPTKYPQ